MNLFPFARLEGNQRTSFDFMRFRKMSSVKRKLANKILTQKYEITHRIEIMRNDLLHRGKLDWAASIKFGEPKNTIWTWVKNKEKLCNALKKT